MRIIQVHKHNSLFYVWLKNRLHLVDNFVKNVTFPCVRTVSITQTVFKSVNQGKQKKRYFYAWRYNWMISCCCCWNHYVLPLRHICSTIKIICTQTMFKIVKNTLISISHKRNSNRSLMLGQFKIKYAIKRERHC